jgi:ABC-type antimicrobial peptide transport system permease subunit
LQASPRDVRTLVVQQALTAALPGIMIGIVLAGGLGMLARSALFGVAPIDTVAFGVAIGALILLVIVASYLPGRRATRIDPAVALRP